MIQPVVYRSSGEIRFLHAYYPPNLMVTEIAEAINGDPGALLRAINDDGSTVDGLVLLAKKLPSGEYGFSDERLEAWVNEYYRRRDL